VSYASIDDNRIYKLIAAECETIGDHYRCLWPSGQIVAGSLSEASINFERCDATAPPNYVCKNGTVVTSASADVDDMLAGIEVETVVEPCPESRLAIVDATRFVERD
jgi:hypothetical protein